MFFSPVFAKLPSSLESIAREFHRDMTSAGLLRLGILIVVGFLVVSTLAYWYRTKEPSWRYYSRSALWRELCRTHELSALERRLLREVSRRARLEPAAAVFLNPAALEAARRDEPDRSRQEELGALYERLFQA